MTILRYFAAQFSLKPLEPPQYAKHERVSNFLSVPFQLEKVKKKESELTLI